MTATMDAAKKILKTVFGYDTFVSIQSDVIANVLARRDTLVVMPTGGGKSLCYQIPALLFNGLTIVVSPLISLMEDQLGQLNAYGVNSVLLNSTLSSDQYRRNMGSIRAQESKLLYIAPESLLKSSVLELLSTVRVDCLAVDEAHCISQWGHDFRPEYRRLAEVRARFKDTVCIGLTATATEKVRSDIKACLGFDESSEFLAGFDRPNLFLEIVPKDNPYRQVMDLISAQNGQPGIVYCATRRQVDQLVLKMEHNGVSALPYHAGLSDADRRRHQERFSKDDVQVMVATVAFGMGIDKSNIRFVVHYDVPKNIEGYYQEIGRAGRDGAKAHCMLLHSYGDIHKIKYQLEQGDEQRQRVGNLLLSAMLRFVETDVCRRRVLLDYFNETYAHDNCGMCDNCTGEPKEKEELTIAAQKFLSCVKRTGERFGMGHIIDVLRASKAQKVINFGHDRLTTYGIGMEYSKQQWQQLARQLLHCGYMTQDMEFGGLQLTGKAWDLFKGQHEFFGIPLMANTKTTPVPHGRSTDSGDDTPMEVDQALFDLLRQKRKELADESNVPPFVIFSDRTLIEMASSYPRSPERFLQISGVGQVKAQKFGRIFMDIIVDYCNAHEIGEPVETDNETPAPDSTAEIRKSPDKKKRYMEIGEAFDAGLSISDIVEKMKIKNATVRNHLDNYLRNGFKISTRAIEEETSLSHEDQTLVMNAFREMGADYLSPVYRFFNETISYDDLHLMRLLYRMTENAGSDGTVSASHDP